MAGTLYIGVGLLKVLSELFVAAEMPSGPVDTGIALGSFNVDVPLLTLIVTGVMVLHNVLGSYMVTTAAGGSTYRIAAYLPLLAWITAFAALGADFALGTFD
jgi:archaellum biogenesis protein FlaJ (TadC family)